MNKIELDKWGYLENLGVLECATGYWEAFQYTSLGKQIPSKQKWSEWILNWFIPIISNIVFKRWIYNYCGCDWFN